MRKRNPAEERTSFQEHGPFDPLIDSKADVAMVYGLDRDFDARMVGWGAAGYRLHVMTGVSWGSYADYVRGEWDGVTHFDDAQTAEGGFKLEHGMAQGHDIYYMMPSMPYVKYLAEKMHRVVDAGALALHLEEPEFWVRAGYEDGFKREWMEFYGEEWQDPTSSPDARYRCEKLKQHVYTRALTYLFADIKRYAREKDIAGFSCYVPTHSLINYAHWRIVSPESQLLSIPDCDGIIGQVWTGTSRTPNVYQGVLRQRTFEAGYCEYAACAAMVRGTAQKVWQLADPIEDNPNYSWDDYRLCWECDVTAALLSPDNVRFEIMPWPSRVFTRSYPKVNLGEKPLHVLVDEYVARLRRDGKPEMADIAQRAVAVFKLFMRDHAEESRKETLGFANLADSSTELQFADILSGAFAFYKYLSTWADQTEAHNLRDALSAFYHDPTEEREYIPAAYATELQVVYNALADMDWQGDYEWIHGSEGIGLAISDTLMYQRGEPHPSDPDLSSFYGLAMPLLKHGTALTMVQLERVVDAGYLDNIRILLLTYEGMKPTSLQMHQAIVEWVRKGNALVLFGQGDVYNTVREWWNQDGLTYAAPQEHLTELLGLGRNPVEGQYKCGRGYVVLNPTSPEELAHRHDGAEVLIGLIKQLVPSMQMPWRETNVLALRRGPYVAISGLDESTADSSVLKGTFANLYDARLAITIDPVILPDTRWLLVDLARCPDTPWVVASAGRIKDETVGIHALSFGVEGMANTTCVVRAKLPIKPVCTFVAGQAHDGEWDAVSSTVLLTFPNQSRGVTVLVEW